MTDGQVEWLHSTTGDPPSELFDSRERAVIAFTDKLTLRPQDMTGADVDALAPHLDATQTVELAIAIATANWTNRLNQGLETPLPRG